MTWKWINKSVKVILEKLSGAPSTLPLTSHNATRICISVGGMIDGTTPQLVCLLISHVPAVARVNNTIRIQGARAYTEHIARHAVAITVNVVQARTLQECVYMYKKQIIGKILYYSYGEACLKRYQPAACSLKFPNIKKAL